jgi:hypothetical protein
LPLNPIYTTVCHFTLQQMDLILLRDTSFFARSSALPQFVVWASVSADRSQASPYCGIPAIRTILRLIRARVGKAQLTQGLGRGFGDRGIVVPFVERDCRSNLGPIEPPIKLCGLCPRAKLVPNFGDRGCHVVIVTDPYDFILGFLG